MEIEIEKKERFTIVRLIGNLDSNTSPQAQAKILPLASNQCYLALDMSRCNYVSSAGLRVLLMLAKQFKAQGGRLGLVGVCEEIKDVMEMTGFINFFEMYNKLEDLTEDK
ncbi:MAG: STAS domain-containing protein [Candidatus Omnitrophica bacterium]|nr:STAS domain-containing protein [Candidatus Omnitrophota bacterium]MCM8823983.1 STAS domain-containing protein [Candidatus Omnitrophota bacterium]MCM8826660.1 STAS domain-containing protein [Candidatus Omnitrophota bacterium]